jgi:hypothetical protein
MDAGAEEGTLTTRTLSFGGRHLFVNLEAPEGELRVELLDEDKVLATSAPLRGNGTRLRVQWPESALESEALKPRRFRFRLTKGKLYSFWVSPHDNGASMGYIGAGGPGYAGSRDLPAGR